MDGSKNEGKEAKTALIMPKEEKINQPKFDENSKSHRYRFLALVLGIAAYFGLYLFESKFIEIFQSIFLYLYKKKLRKYILY